MKVNTVNVIEYVNDAVLSVRSFIDDEGDDRVKRESNAEAKQKAIEWYRNITLENGYNFSEGAADSLKEMIKHFGGKIKDYEIDFYNNSHSFIQLDMPDMEEAEIKNLLDTLGTYNPDTLKGHGDCVLTGVCFDEDVIDGFRMEWHKGERDLNKLMQAGFKTWLKACQSDAQSQLEDEYIIETIQVNEYEFTSDGKRFVVKG